MFTSTAGTIDVRTVSDGMQERIEYYNPTGRVMVTRDREEAMRATDSVDAFDIARIAKVIYRRGGMRIGMAS